MVPVFFTRNGKEVLKIQKEIPLPNIFLRWEHS